MTRGPGPEVAVWDTALGSPSYPSERNSTSTPTPSFVCPIMWVLQRRLFVLFSFHSLYALILEGLSSNAPP